MKNVIIITLVGGAMLGIGLAIGGLAEVSQILVFSGIIVAVVYGSAAAVFAISLYATFRLWKIVLDAMQGAETAHSKALLELIGGFTVSAFRKEDASQRRIRVAGTGLLGTMAIVGFACGVIYIMFSIIPTGSDVVKIGR